MVAIDGFFNFYIVFLQLEGSIDGNVEVWHIKLAILNGNLRLMNAAAGIVAVVELVKLIARVRGHCHSNRVVIVGCGRSRNRTVLNSVGNPDVVEFFSESGLDGHVARRHLKGVDAIALGCGVNSCDSAAHERCGLQCCNLIARVGGHCQSHLVAHAGCGRSRNGAMLNAIGNRDVVGLFSERGFDGHIVSRHLEGV